MANILSFFLKINWNYSFIKIVADWLSFNRVINLSTNPSSCNCGTKASTTHLLENQQKVKCLLHTLHTPNLIPIWRAVQPRTRLRQKCHWPVIFPLYLLLLPAFQCCSWLSLDKAGLQRAHSALIARESWTTVSLSTVFLLSFSFLSSLSLFFASPVKHYLLYIFFYIFSPSLLLSLSLPSLSFAFTQSLTLSRSLSLGLYSKRIGCLLLPTSVYHCPGRAKQRGDGGVSQLDSNTAHRQGWVPLSFSSSLTHTLYLVDAWRTHTNKHARSTADSRNIRIAGCPPRIPLSFSPRHSLSARTPLSLTLLWPQRLILPSCPLAAVCHRGHIASAAMATSQQDSGFFDISIKSLLKSLGGSEYS